jgi:hypothetical protein
MLNPSALHAGNRVIGVKATVCPTIVGRPSALPISRSVSVRNALECGSEFDVGFKLYPLLRIELVPLEESPPIHRLVTAEGLDGVYGSRAARWDVARANRDCE